MIYYFEHTNDFRLFVQAKDENEAWNRLIEYEDDSLFNRNEWSISELDGDEYVGEKM